MAKTHKAANKPVEDTKGRTIADFRAAHDRNVIIPNRIRKALADMRAKGPQHWEYESDFIKQATVSQTDISRFREQFAGYWVSAPAGVGRAGATRNIWFATERAATEAKG